MSLHRKPTVTGGKNYEKYCIELLLQLSLIWVSTSYNSKVKITKEFSFNVNFFMNFQ